MLPQWGNPSTLYLDYMVMHSTNAGMRQSEKDTPYWLLIKYYWSQKGVNWLSRSRQNTCRENMLNSNSDWPHGSVDAAFIIAFAWCFCPFFNICCDMQCAGEQNIFLVMQMMFVARRFPAETNIWEWFLPHQHKQPIRCCWQSPRTDGCKSRECAAAVLTTFTGQGGICHRGRKREREREREEKGQGERRGERRWWLEHNRFQ